MVASVILVNMRRTDAITWLNSGDVSSDRDEFMRIDITKPCTQFKADALRFRCFRPLVIEWGGCFPAYSCQVEAALSQLRQVTSLAPS